MIKETDASKNDERRVKNKPNPLTHKRKGETRTMYNQSTKHWKLGAFFVISLMLVAGLFTNTASAQTAAAVVTVGPNEVTAQEVINSVTVTYTITGAAIDAENVITVGLPTNWAPAYANDGTADGTASFGSFTGTTGDIDLDGDSTATPPEKAIRGVSSLPARTSSRTASYVVVTYLTRVTGSAVEGDVSISGNTVTVTKDAEDGDDATPDVMAVGDKVIVIFHNVMVRPMTTADLDANGDRDPDRDPDMVAIIDSAITQDPDDNDFGDATDIQVNHRAMSNVSVSPPSVKTESTANVVVRYTVNEAVIGDNVVNIQLPLTWENAKPWYNEVPGTVSVLEALPEGKDTKDTKNIRDTMSYVVLTTTVDKAVDTDDDTSLADEIGYELTVDDLAKPGPEVQITVRGGMSRREQIVLTFYSVKVPELTVDRDSVDAQFTVEDSIVGSNYTANAVIEIEPTDLSTVSVSPSSVEDGSVEDMTVIYTAQDRIYGGNTVMIGLPDNWEPAYAPYGDPTSTFESFGDEVLPKAPRDAKRNTTSYVVLTKDVDSDTSGKTDAQLEAMTPPIIDRTETDVTSELVLGVANAVLEVTVPGMMVKGDKITVVFHNVIVLENIDSEAADAQFTVIDDIVGSDYDSSAVVRVTPLKLGKVSVTPDSVTAGGMVDLKVKYAATKALSFGRIQVTLPTSRIIHEERQTGDSDATYVTVDSSRSVELAEDVDGDPDYLSVRGNEVTIDVDSMSRGQYVTLIVHNLSISALSTPRDDRYEDIATAGLMDMVQVMVLSDQYADAADRLGRDPVMPPESFSPSEAYDAKTLMGSDEQPTLTVNRKILGELAVEPAEVTAGSEKDFTITYKATEALAAGDVIEVKLPAGWLAPPPYNFNLSNKLEAADGTLLADALKAAKAAKKSHLHAYLSGSISRLEGAVISVINGNGIDAFDAAGERDATVDSSDGWFVRIVLGSKGVSKNGTIVLKYNDATVQRSLTTDDIPASVEAFSGTSASVNDLPQFPVKEQEKDKITVKHAADGFWYGHVRV